MLANLAAVLSSNPGAASLSTLLWMLRNCQSPIDVRTITSMARAVGSIPIPMLAEILRDGNADQRLTAAYVLSSVSTLVAPEDRDAYAKAMISAVSDPYMNVREAVAGRVRELGSPDAAAALAAVLQDPEATRMFVGQATGHGAPVIVPPRVPLPLTIDSIHRPGLSIADLVAALPTASPDERYAIAGLFGALFPLRAPPLTVTEREWMINALTVLLRDRHIHIRTAAARGLGFAQATTAVEDLIMSVNRPDVTNGHRMVVIEALSTIASPAARAALEQWARTAPTDSLRDAATRAFVRIMKPADEASEARRLLLPGPDSELERAVLAQGRNALPRAWRALSGRSDADRRTAAALLAWIPDARSVRPILAALDRSPGAVTREQLLFDLNMILMQAGSAATTPDANALAAQHLQSLFAELMSPGGDPNLKTTVLRQKRIAVFPDRVTAPFSVQLSADAISTAAVRSESEQAFRDAVAGDGFGVAFHAITVAGGVARVATTMYLPRGSAAHGAWITLYRRKATRWVPLDLPPHPAPYSGLREPNLLPTIDRNYGLNSPMRILRLDLTMERIRVDMARWPEEFRFENEDVPGIARPVDASYAPLMERYKQSDSLAVRYTAHYQSATLTGRPDVNFWMAALREQSGNVYQTMARGVIGAYASRELEATAQELTGDDREPLVQAATAPDLVDPLLHPKRLPKPENITRVRATGRFGEVEVRFGTDPDGGSGYTMLFERRDNRWVFLLVTRYWIS